MHLPEFDFQQFHTDGAIYQEAAQNGQEVIESLVTWYQEAGKPLPKPKLSESLENAA